ncbi:helix-turn-helix domain-containing protein [Achromobacter ruhlandii]|uniref:helix-turn-helix domain-containing protein n=1 Tax=Achromobacter ruhlandii TaxID=72557 RepID=UPI003557016B
MTARYTHLQPEDRLTLASLHQQGFSQRAMARLLGRSPSTIGRELKRNRSSAEAYALAA